jgi:hypothetical protein
MSSGASAAQNAAEQVGRVEHSAAMWHMRTRQNRARNWHATNKGDCSSNSSLLTKMCYRPSGGWNHGREGVA